MKILVNTSTASVKVEMNGDLNAEELQHLIAELGNARAQITKATERPMGQQAVIVGPGFWAQWDITKDQHFCLSFTHPGLGWVNFALTPITVEGIKIYMDQYLGATQARASATATETDVFGGGGTVH